MLVNFPSKAIRSIFVVKDTLVISFGKIAITTFTKLYLNAYSLGGGGGRAVLIKSMV